MQHSRHFGSGVRLQYRGNRPRSFWPNTVRAKRFGAELYSFRVERASFRVFHCCASIPALFNTFESDRSESNHIEICA